MPHALLLSPDDQAVSAITGVLEEMSVTCERPMDGVSAAQKLNSQSFDLVLVDCENLPAAKLIFDVCRRGKNGNNPVPIAIVDGRAGLPTAFRLGAELILTKPVAKDQARTTIRTAVGRVRKDVPAESVSPAHPPVVEGRAEERAQAAAANASSQLTSFSDPAPSFASATAPGIAQSPTPTVTLSTAAVAPTTSPAVVENDTHDMPAAPRSAPRSVVPAWSSLPSQTSSTVTAPQESKSTVALKPSDDPVLAELERTEQEELDEAKHLENPAPIKPTTDHASERPSADSSTPVSSSYQKTRQKPSRSLLALLMLMLAGAAFYTAWMYQPEFRELAQPQIDRVLALIGMPRPAQNTTPVLRPAKPSVPPAATATAASAPVSSVDPSQTQPLAQDSAVGSSNGPSNGPANNPTTVTSMASNVPVTSTQPSAAPVGAMVPPSSATTVGAPVVGKSGVGKTDSKTNDIKTGDAKIKTIDGKTIDGKTIDGKTIDDKAASSSASLPGESSAIILSSKGAEKRLLHSAPPKYPAGARAAGAEGTVVLKEVVDETGKVAAVRLVEGDAALATAAINAVKLWRYRPYLRDGKAQPFQTVVIVDFQRP
jgi:TonB family protein